MSFCGFLLLRLDVEQLLVLLLLLSIVTMASLLYLSLSV